MLSTKLKEAAGNSADATLYVDDVFSTYLYTGNGSTQTITNGIDLAGKGGMVWIKDRNSANSHILSDTVRGTNSQIASNLTNAAFTFTNEVTAFNSNGFSLGSDSLGCVNNSSAGPYVSWTFREAAKFFDVVTFTGNGSLTNIVNHNLGVTPGFIIVKGTSASGSRWVCAAKDNSGNYVYLVLNTTVASDASTVISNIATTTTFNPGYMGVYFDGYANTNGVQYVAYLFAHDTSATGIIQCGLFTTDGSAGATVNLGWEPQYILMKTTDLADNWNVFDTMRGFAQTSSMTLKPNLANAEGQFGSGTVVPTATGFNINLSVGGAYYNNKTFIYMAIRMPNKPPTSGTQVFSPVYTSSASNPLTVTTNFPVDASIYTASSISGQVMKLSDRLRGSSYAGTTKYLEVSSTSAEITKSSPAYLGFDSNVSLIDSSFLAGGTNPKIYWSFKRAPGFFDEVCYTGTGVATTQAHNLGAVPELMIVKERSAVNNWWVYDAIDGNTKYSVLNSTAIPVTSSTAWNNTTPTASAFSIGAGANVNASTQTFVAYLFATLAGISKVGSYTGNGTGQAIACGFSAGARFVLIKRTDSTGDWYTFDSARGLTVGSSPYLLLNSTAAEVTGNNGVYASTGGFTLGATAITTTNILGASYIYLSVA